MRKAPTEVRYRRAERVLELVDSDGRTCRLAAEYLRVESPSAEVQGHGTSTKKIVPRCPDIAITAMEPVGTYAVRLCFSDGHDTGLYSWDYLHQLYTEYDTRWPAYLAAATARAVG